MKGYLSFLILIDESSKKKDERERKVCFGFGEGLLESAGTTSIERVGSPLL